MDLASFVSFPDRSQDLYESLANAVQDDRAYSIPDPDVSMAVMLRLMQGSGGMNATGALCWFLW